MILDDPEGRRRFLSLFASLGGWAAGGLHVDGSQLDLVLATVDDERFPGAVLPRVRSQGTVEFYAIATTAAQWRELSPLVRAFVGITASNFRGSPTPLDIDDPLERWIYGLEFAATARFTADDDRTRQRLILVGLQRLRENLGRSAAPHRGLPRSTVQLLHDFQLALSGRDRPSAVETISFLRENMRLDALNLRSLEVQLEATFERWEDVRGHPAFSSLVQARRTPRLTAALVEALYHTEIAQYVATGDAEQALMTFRHRVLPVSGSLFRVLPPLASQAVCTAFVLAALSQEPHDWAAAERIAATLDTETRLGSLLLTSLLALRPTGAVIEHPSVRPSPFDELEAQLLAAQDLTQAPTVDRALGVLVAATDVGTIAAYETAAAYVDRLSQEEREQLLSRRSASALWEDVAAYRVADSSVPRNWIEWLNALPTMPYGKAQAIADAATLQWPISHHLVNEAAVRELAERLLTGPEERVAEAVPLLLEWLRTDPHWPNPNHLPILEALFTLLAITARRTPAALAAVTQVVDALLSIGLSQVAYRLVLRDLGDLLTGALSMRTIDWSLDLLEVLMMHPAADREALAKFWDEVLGALQPMGPRLELRQREITTDLANMAGRGAVLTTLGSPPVVAEAEFPGSELGHILVAIYTLTENVGRRLRQAVLAEFPNVNVELVHELVNSPRLSDLARRADLFVVCWQSAKHAATLAIKQARPSSRPTLFPTGRGSSSISREIREFAIRTFGSERPTN